MALFPQMHFSAGGLDDRTHTNLVRSEGMSPAEKWILDPDLEGLFEYRFGGFGMVVIPKGKIVAVTAPKYDWETERVVNCLTIANGTNIPIGVAPYNFYEKKRDRMGDNQVSIINREYIEVPFIAGAEAAAQMKWGCATADTFGDLTAGDFVKPNAAGQFVKWEEGTDSFAQLVGQILAVETADIAPLGWLAYFLNMEAQVNEYNEYVKQGGYAPATAGGYPGTAKFADLVKQAFGPGAENAAGIKYLTDGYFRAKKTYGNIGTSSTVALSNVADISAAVCSDGCSIASNGTLTIDAEVKDGQIVIPFKFPVAGDEGVLVKFDSDVKKDGYHYHVDHFTNKITLYVNGDSVKGNNSEVVTIACTLVEDQVPGLPTEWDYKGSVGACRILLSK